MNPRLERLQNDYQDLLEFTGSSRVAKIAELEGSPPEKYVLNLTCLGIVGIDGGGTPQFSRSHRLGIWLHQTYPKQKPILQMLTPIWHPNIAGSGDVCIGSEGNAGWAPAMKLSDVVLRTLHIIRYENIGWESVYNGVAENWASEYKRRNPRAFPIDTSDMMNPELDIRIFDDDDNSNNLLDQIQFI